MKFKLATAQYNISFLKAWADYEAKVKRWVDEAVQHGAKLLLFPEYASMELASLFGEEVYSSLSKQLAAMQTVRGDYLELFKTLAVKHQCYIQSGSFPVEMETNVYRNRADLFFPDGRVEYQDKLIMTRFENEHWFISAGNELKTFDTEFGRLAINICYDSEFPMLARKQVERGANLILVPSCTDTLAGYHRVKIGCQARALENQCYVVQACLVGEAPWSEAVDVNIGSSAIYTPVDRGYPDNGILVAGKLNGVQWVIGEVSLASCEEVRRQGQVFNFRDWPLQLREFN